MRPGDMVCMKPGRSHVQLLSDYLENSTDFKKIVFTDADSRALRKGETGIVIEINRSNLARVKIFFDSGFWWANISDLLVIE